MTWVLLLFAQVQAPTADAPSKRPVEIQSLADRARALPPEFAADLALKLAASKLIVETKWKRELIEEAFLSAARAPLPYRQRGDGLTDSRPSQEVADNKQDKLTLQTRAVEAMLEIELVRALALYQEIVAPEVPPIPCKEIITPDVSAYYQTAAKVFERSFTPKQRKDGDDLQFLKTRIAQVQSPLHLPPALRMISAVKLPDVQRQELTAQLAGVLERLSGTDRVYKPAEMELLGAAVPQLRDTPLIVPALRAYIVRQIAGPRCGDYTQPRNLIQSAESFNRLAKTLDPAGVTFKPITAEEAKPGKDEGGYERHEFWQSARSKKVLDALKWLNHGNRDLPDKDRFWKPEERATLEWNTHYMDLLKLIEGWKEEEEDAPADYLFMVAHTYALLADLVPPGPPRENAMGQYLNFLETRYSAAANRNLWFAQAQQMLDRARRAKDDQDRQWILDRLVRSANPIIATYAEMERRLGK